MIDGVYGTWSTNVTPGDVTDTNGNPSRGYNTDYVLGSFSHSASGSLSGANGSFPDFATELVAISAKGSPYTYEVVVKLSDAATRQHAICLFDYPFYTDADSGGWDPANGVTTDSIQLRSGTVRGSPATLAVAQMTFDSGSAEPQRIELDWCFVPGAPLAGRPEDPNAWSDADGSPPASWDASTGGFDFPHTFIVQPGETIEYTSNYAGPWTALVKPIGTVSQSNLTLKVNGNTVVGSTYLASADTGYPSVDLESTGDLHVGDVITLITAVTGDDPLAYGSYRVWFFSTPPTYNSIALSATAAVDTAHLTWDTIPAGDGGSSYYISYGVYRDGALIATITDTDFEGFVLTNYDDVGITPGVTYTYEIRGTLYPGSTVITSNDVDVEISVTPPPATGCIPPDVSTDFCYSCGPYLHELLSEAAEMAGVDPAVLTGRHISSAMRSLRLMVNSEWVTLGIRQWMIREQQTHTTAVGEVSFKLPKGAIDIVGASLRRPGSGLPGTSSDVEMYPISRSEYLQLTNKTIQGRPDRYFVDRQPGCDQVNGTSNITVYYWQAGSNTTDQIVFDLFQQMTDVEDSLGAGLALPAYAYKSLVHGWAANLALKWNPQKFTLLDNLYRGQASQGGPIGGFLGAMLMEDRERSDITIYPVFEPRLGRR